MHKKVISFSLWGDSEKYTIGSIENARLAQKYYPGWICRFYIGQSTIRLAPEIVERLSLFNNTEIIRMPIEGDWDGMFWRFSACSDPEVDYVLSRDCDSRLSLRESKAVKEWVKSGKSFHIIRDHPWHSGLLILGGLWGAQTHILRDMDIMISNYDKLNNSYNSDQEFLAERVYPRVKESCLIHDDFNGGRKIPGRRKKNEFVGQVIDPLNERTIEHEIALKKELEKRKIFVIMKKFTRDKLKLLQSFFKRF